MKYLIINDEHELYRQMYADLFVAEKYSVEEIERIKIPKCLKSIFKLHINGKINRHFWLPFKEIWNRFYQLDKYDFKNSENYCVLFLNGTLDLYFNKKYLLKFKKNNPNVLLVVILYDTISNIWSKNTINILECFDLIFSFDKEDCEKYGYELIYGTFSKPDFIKRDASYYSKAFFIGQGKGRLDLLQKVFTKITSSVEKCKFIIADVHKINMKPIKDVIYNQRMAYSEELQMAYNTDCIIEVVKGNQAGVSLRTCEAICFNKKLLSNNRALKDMPFYDPKYMSIFQDENDVDLSFIEKTIDVRYSNTDYFSPLRIIEKIEKLRSENE